MAAGTILILREYPAVAIALGPGGIPGERRLGDLQEGQMRQDRFRRREIRFRSRLDQAVCISSPEQARSRSGRKIGNEAAAVAAIATHRPASTATALVHSRRVGQMFQGLLTDGLSEK